MADVERLRRIKTFVDELGVNLAGAEVALKLIDRITELEGQVEALTNEVNRLRAAGNTAGDGRTRNNSTRRDNATRR